MADKILKTRIKLRYDTLEKWEAANPTLLEGEIAVVKVTTQKLDPDTGNVVDVPATLFKVGAKKDTSTLYKFNELPWASGMAADIYDWAKKDKLSLDKDTIYYVQGIQQLIPETVVKNHQLILYDSMMEHANYTILYPTGNSLENTQKYIYTDAMGHGVDIIWDVNTNAYKFNIIDIENSDIFYDIYKWDYNSNIDSETNPTVIVGDLTYDQNSHTLTSYGTNLLGDNTNIVVEGDLLHENISIKHAQKGPSTGYTSGNTTTSISGSGSSGTIKIPQLTVDKYGHVTAAADENVTITMPTIPGITVTPDTATGSDPGKVNSVTVLKDISANGHTITQTGVTVPTTHYVDTAIETAVAGAVDYLDTVGSVSELAAKQNLATKGDFVRVSGKFILNDEQAGQPEDLYPGDLLIANVNKPRAVTNDWDIIRGDLGGTVTSITAGTGLTSSTGGAITSSGTIGVDFGTGTNQVAKGDHTHDQYLQHNTENIESSTFTLSIALDGGDDFTFIDHNRMLTTNGDAEGLGLYKGQLGWWSAEQSIQSEVPKYTYVLPKKAGTIALTSDINNGTLTINNGTGISGGPIEFTANASTAVTKSLSVTHWSSMIHANTDNKLVYNTKASPTEENFIVLDGGAADTWPVNIMLRLNPDGEGASGQFIDIEELNTSVVTEISLIGQQHTDTLSIPASRAWIAYRGDIPWKVQIRTNDNQVYTSELFGMIQKNQIVRIPIA